MRTLQVNSETTMFSSAVPIPTIGVLAVNAYLVGGAQPTLIDTGITPESDDFLDALRAQVDLRDLRWIVITHADRDHVGALMRLLDESPDARVVTTFLTVGLMSVGAEPIPPERSLLVRDGSTLDIGDRTLRFVRPPLFDNPGTVGIFDPAQNVLFSADCFGAPFTTPEGALADDVATTPPDELETAQLLWASVDSPWAHYVETERMAANIAAFVQDRPDTVLSTHLPPIRGDLDRHVATLTKLPTSTPVAPADQAALEDFLATMGQP
jgi:flavorubredoxin